MCESERVVPERPISSIRWFRVKLIGMQIVNTSALKISLVLITSVVAIESFAGLITNSFALLGDASHATFDSLTTAILFLTARWATRPADRNHTYGHAKIETLGGMIGGILLFSISFILVFESVTRLVYEKAVVSPGFIGFSAALYTLAVDFTRIAILRSAGSGATVKADFYHAITDLASTLVALSGLVLASFGYYGGDSFAGILLGFLLGILSIKLVKRTSLELSDATSTELQSQIERIILGTTGVTRCSQLRTRKAGEKLYVDATIVVPGDLDLSEAHGIASKVESNIANTIGNTDIIVHVEPKNSDLMMERQVKNIAHEISGVKDIHDIKILNLRDGMHLSLHAQVDPRTDFIDAHDIAEQLEQRIREKTAEVKHVFVHLELYHGYAAKAERFEDRDLQQKIWTIVTRHKEVKALKRSRMYLVGGKYQIYLDCLMDSGQSLEAVHQALSHIEQELKDLLPNSVVEIHSEPF